MTFCANSAVPVQARSIRLNCWSIPQTAASALLVLAQLFAGTAFSGSLEYNTTPGTGNQSFATRYSAYYTTYGCSACHTTAPTLQVYGTAYRTAVFGLLGGRIQANVGPALASIESADSDADGYSNIIEINNNTKTWDSANHPTAAVALSTALNAKSGAAGTTVSYAVTVTNNGNLTDSFTLGVSVTTGQSWSPSIVGSANNVAAGGTASITVNVAIAGGATATQTSVATVTATSQANTGISATGLPLTTTATSAAVAGNRYVNAATGVDSVGICDVQANPCKTITYAMLNSFSAPVSDIIHVAPGTYNLALGEVFPIFFKYGVQLIATGSPANTIIDATGDTVKRGIFKSTNNASALSRIEGFTISNGRGTTTQLGVATGGGLIVNSASALFTITRNIFSSNQVTGYTGDSLNSETGGLGWGGAIYGAGSTVEISNNIFTNNVAQGGNGFSDFATPATNKNGGPGEGGAIYISGSGKIINNTFYNNNAQGGNGGVGVSGSSGIGGNATAGAISSGGITVSNNIFSTNKSLGGSGSTSGVASAGALSASGATITNNLFFGNTVSGVAGTADTTGISALTSDPQFQAAPSNLKIKVGSPASGAGTATGAPSTDFAGTTRPSPPAIGAYEPSAAAQTVTFTPATPVIYGTTAITLTASASSGLTSFTFSTSSLSSICTVAGNQLTIVGGGICALTATQPGNASFASASASANVVINAANQTVTFTPATPVIYGTTAITLAASASSGLTSFTFSTSSLSSICTVAGNQLTINGVGTCALTATQPGNASYTSASANANVVINPAFTAVQSRKTHGGTGDFDLAIDTTQVITGAVTVEPRTIGSGHTIVFQFNGRVSTAGTVTVTPVGTATATFLGNEVLVTLTSIPDNQRVTVTLANVNGSTNPPPVSIGFLVGDINNTRSVNASDISSVKARSGQSTTASNFKHDLNASGAINSNDISAVKARSGLVLP